MRNLAIVVMSSDKYSFLWDGWYHYYRKNIGVELPIYLINETVDCKLLKINQIKINIPEINLWTKRLREGIKQIPYKHIFLCLEDVYFAKELRPEFEFLYNSFHYCSYDSLRIETVKSKKVIAKNTLIQFQQTYIKKLIQNSWYLISYAPCFWKKEFLLKCIETDEDPWHSEIEGSKRLYGYPHNICQMLIEGSHVNVIQKGKVTKQGQILINEYNENSLPDYNI